jgi:hypothetical protein
MGWTGTIAPVAGVAPKEIGMSDERVRKEKKAPSKPDDLIEIDNLEIAPLSEEDLNAVVGGVGPLDSDCTSRGGADGRDAS